MSTSFPPFATAIRNKKGFDKDGISFTAKKKNGVGGISSMPFFSPNSGHLVALNVVTSPLPFGDGALTGKSFPNSCR